MCAVTISEYSNMLMLTGGHLPIVGEPSIRTQVLEVGDASQVSEAFGPAVKFIRISTADEAVALKFGTNPVATSADARMSANTTELFAVQIGQRVAAVAMERSEHG